MSPEHQPIYGGFCPYCGHRNTGYAEYFRSLDNACPDKKRTHGSWITETQYAGYVKIAGNTHLVGINIVHCNKCEDMNCQATIREIVAFTCRECQEEFRCEVPNHEQTARKVLLQGEDSSE